MYITYYNCDDCPSERDYMVVAKGRTLLSCVNRTLEECDWLDEIEKVEYDGDYVYLDGEKAYDIHKI